MAMTKVRPGLATKVLFKPLGRPSGLKRTLVARPGRTLVMAMRDAPFPAGQEHATRARLRS
jgi:hypothetical protein